MAPGNKRTNAKTKPAAADSSHRPAGTFSLELRQGEVDKANTEYNLALEGALETLEGHDIFKNMVQCEPRAIAGSATDTGFQSVFDMDMYTTAIASGTGAVTVIGGLLR